MDVKGFRAMSPPEAEGWRGGGSVSKCTWEWAEFLPSGVSCSHPSHLPPTHPHFCPTSCLPPS